VSWTAGPPESGSLQTFDTPYPLSDWAFPALLRWSPALLLLLEDHVIDELYDLIGGKRTVWAATEAFYKRVLADDTLRPFFKTTDMAQLRARQSMFISMLLGGRVVYTGKDIHDAHAHAREQGRLRGQLKSGQRGSVQNRPTEEPGT
jgi:hypothetical protein